MKVTSIKPEFGVNYDVGYIGFTMTSGDVISEGIAWFERWERLSDIKVSHAFVVTGNNELVEAHIEHGVQRDCISKYFNDPKVLTFFRKPQHLTAGMAKTIADAAASKLGAPYATPLILSEMLGNSIVGHEVNKLLGDKPNEEVSALAQDIDPKAFICSGLAAFALRAGFYPLRIGVLEKPINVINPQMLFEDAEIFEPWANETPAKAGTPNTK